MGMSLPRPGEIILSAQLLDKAWELAGYLERAAAAGSWYFRKSIDAYDFPDDVLKVLEILERMDVSVLRSA